MANVYSGVWYNVTLPAYASAGANAPAVMEAVFEPQPALGPAYIKVPVAEADEFVAWLRAAHDETCGSAREAYGRVAKKLGIDLAADVR